MASNSTEVMWGPGLIADSRPRIHHSYSVWSLVTQSLSNQLICRIMKALWNILWAVMTVFLFDTINQLSMMAVYWSILISCRRSMSLQCTTETPLRQSWQYLRHFYASRVWIITGNNHWITGLIRVVMITNHHRQWFREALKSCSPRRVYMVVHATSTNSIVAITVTVLFYTAAPGAVLGKSYMNSMMTVLNARKSIREREQLGYNLTELPTILTIR
ncbi:hypothetical protein BDR04DRAFT_1180442 [Suillus decipiens]|nr:hypothetical protein BDR04DRAFT_1180442 [Suillus decipiens]